MPGPHFPETSHYRVVSRNGGTADNADYGDPERVLIWASPQHVQLLLLNMLRLLDLGLGFKFTRLEVVGLKGLELGLQGLDSKVLGFGDARV